MKDTIIIHNKMYKQYKNLNTTTWEFGNAIIQIPNFINKDIYNIVPKHISENPDLMAEYNMFYADKILYNIYVYQSYMATIKSNIVSNNLEFKDDYIIAHLDDLSLAVPSSVINDSYNKPIITFSKSNLKDDDKDFVYIISLSTYFDAKYNFAIVDFYSKDKNIVIDFGNINYIIDHTIHMDSNFMDVYTKVFIENI